LDSGFDDDFREYEHRAKAAASMMMFWNTIKGQKFPPKLPMPGVITSISRLPTTTDNRLNTQISHPAKNKMKQVKSKKISSSTYKGCFL
jgi:hypothetical protein